MPPEELVTIPMTTENPPKVSVAMPVYNGESYIAEAIESVLAQSLGDFEFIICDNSSSDRTVEIARSFADPRIRVLQNERNLGFGPNWNRCLQETRGRYIKILPHDDLLHPRCLEAQARILDEDPQEAIALVFCARRIIGPRGKELMTRGPRGPKAIHSGPEMARKTALSGTNPIGEPGAVLFRAAAARAAGPFNESRPFVIDIDYWLRLLKFGNAVYLPEALASFRISSGSQSVRITRQQAGEFKAFLGEMRGSGLYQLSGAELRIGGVTALMNSYGRAMFYWLAMRDAR